MLTWTPHPLLSVPTDDEIAVLTPDELVKLHDVREEAIRNSVNDKFRYGWIFKNWRKVEEYLADRNEALISGGNRCLGAEQEIYDPVANTTRRVDEIDTDFHVYAWNGHQKVVARAEKPFRKPLSGIYQVSLNNGQLLFCSKAHRLLTPDGWRSLGSLQTGDSLVSSQPLFGSVKIVSVDYLREDVVWDFHVPGYENYVASGVISHNSGKTQFGAWAVVKAAVDNPNSDIFCFAQTAEVSIRQQQSAVYDWLPAEYKTKQTSSSTYMSYKRKTGFTDNSFILPNGSRVSFKTYAAYANNPTILEGAELGSLESTWLNVGVWLDEYLGGPEIIETLRFRLATRNSKMILTFTPIFGMTDVVKQYVDGAKVLEKREAELLNNEQVPTILECKNIKGTVHYFWSEDNPWGGYPRIKDTLVGKPRNEVLVRAYGVATKSHHTKFPKFNKAVNVIKPEAIPRRDVTRYHIIDPAGAKNWFMCWVAVDATGTFYVYREWPGVDVGDWAEWKGGKWVPGEGARGQGYGIKDYVELIRELENGEEIFERLIDPRLGAAQYQSADGSSSIIEDLEENDMSVIPAPGLHIDDGIQALIGKMSWDTGKPMDSVNRPHFYVSEECENIIQGLSEYTGEQGLKEAWKDVIDVCRYAAIAGIDHVEAGQTKVTVQGGGGY
jgi:hypothetical protein